MKSLGTLVLTVDAIADEQIVPVIVGRQHLILVRHAGQLFACERACPHEQADLTQGRCADGKLHCPRHMACFALDDGEVSLGWDFRRLRTYAVRVYDNKIFVADERMQD